MFERVKSVFETRPSTPREQQLQEQNEQLKSENTSLKLENSNLNSKVSSITIQYNTLFNDYSTLSGQYDSLLSQHNQLKSDVTALSTELNNYKTTSVSKADYDSLQTENRNLKNSINQYNQMITELQNNSVPISDYNKLQTEYNNFKSNAVAKSDYNNLLSNYNSVKTILNSTNNSIINFEKYINPNTSPTGANIINNNTPDYSTMPTRVNTLYSKYTALDRGIKSYVDAVHTRDETIKTQAQYIYNKDQEIATLKPEANKVPILSRDLTAEKQKTVTLQNTLDKYVQYKTNATQILNEGSTICNQIMSNQTQSKTVHPSLVMEANNYILKRKNYNI